MLRAHLNCRTEPDDRWSMRVGVCPCLAAAKSPLVISLVTQSDRSSDKRTLARSMSHIPVNGDVMSNRGQPQDVPLDGEGHRASHVDDQRIRTLLNRGPRRITGPHWYRTCVDSPTL